GGPAGTVGAAELRPVGGTDAGREGDGHQHSDSYQVGSLRHRLLSLLFTLARRAQGRERSRAGSGAGAAAAGESLYRAGGVGKNSGKAIQSFRRGFKTL